MLNYKNENWWVYNWGVIICGVSGFIVGIIYHMNKKSLDSSSICILMNIQQIMIIILLGLIGSTEVFAKNSRKGYVYYLIGFLIFITLILRTF